MAAAAADTVRKRALFGYQGCNLRAQEACDAHGASEWHCPASAAPFNGCIHVLTLCSNIIVFSPTLFLLSQFAVEGIVNSRKRKGSDLEHVVAWEGHVEAARTSEPEAAFADGGDEVLAAFRKRRRKEGKQKQQGGDTGGAAAAAEESAVQVEEEPVDDAVLLQKRKRKPCSVEGCIAYAVARGVCSAHALSLIHI